MRSIVFVILSLVMAFKGADVSGQDTLHITLINDDSINYSLELETLFSQEIRTLISSRHTVLLNEIYTGQDQASINQALDLVYAEGQTDIVIGLGLATSTVLSRRNSYPIPSISSVIIDRELLGLPMTAAGSSGVDNFTYVASPFNVQRDLEIFQRIVPYKKLAILTDTNISGFSGFLGEYFDKRMPPGVDYAFIGILPTMEATLAQITEEFDAAYILTTARYDEAVSRELYHELNHMGIPSFALTGRDQVTLGALAGLASSNYIPTLARRVAVDVLKISEGINASELPVTVTTLDEDFVINMQSLRHLEIYPDFDLLNQAILLNLEETDGETTWSIESLIYEALQQNLQLQSAGKNLLLADEDIAIATSNLLPQVAANTSASWIDPNRVDNSNGQAASVSWLANVTINQLIYSEPVMANLAIQRILKSSQDAGLRITELDIILETAQAYLAYLQAKSNVRIQNENVDVTNQNLNISKSKERLGYSGISDVYRLQTQLSQNIINLNTTVSNLAQARININRIINRDQREEFNTIDITVNKMVSLAANTEMTNSINNQRDLDRLSDFLVERAFQRLPELQQFGFSIQAQERGLLSSKRTLYLPEISVQAGLDQPIQYFGTSTPPTGFPGLNKNPQMSVGARLSIPIFEGGFRKATIQRDQLSLDQLKVDQNDYKNSLEAALRSSMAILSASYQQVQLTVEAASYSQKNFDIIQDLYRQGQADIITLVDAQNASLTARLNANNSLYQLVSDFLAVERATGDFYFLLSDEGKETFLLEFSNALLKE